MNANILDNGRGVTYNFFKYVSLNVLSMIGFSVYILADTFFIANGVGNNGLVALNLVLPIFSVMNGFGLMLGVGGATRYAISRGAGNKAASDRAFADSLIPGLIAGILITLCGTIFPRQICTLLGADAEVIELAVTYLRTLCAFAVAFVLNHIVTCFVRNDNAPKLAMFAMLTGSFSNIILDYVFIFPCNMGIFGAVIATGLSPILSLCVLSLHFIRRKNNFKFRLHRPKVKNLKQIIGAGVPSFITEMSNGTVILVFNFVLLKLAGNVGVGAYSVIANLALVCVCIFNGIGQGIQPLVSYAYGAEKKKEMLKTLMLALITALSIGIVLYIICYAARYGIIGLFNKDKIPELTTIAVKAMIYYCLAFVVTGVNIAVISFMAGTGRTLSSFILSLLRGFAMPLPLVLILSNTIGLTGVWISVPLAELITAIVAAIMCCLTIRAISKNKADKSVGSLLK